jgi:hypothetical protein
MGTAFCGVSQHSRERFQRYVQAKHFERRRDSHPLMITQHCQDPNKVLAPMVNHSPDVVNPVPPAKSMGANF